MGSNTDIERDEFLVRGGACMEIDIPQSRAAELVGEPRPDSLLLLKKGSTLVPPPPFIQKLKKIPS